VLRCLQRHRHLVFGADAIRENVELQGADDPHDPVRSNHRLENPGRTLLCQLQQRSAQVLGLERIEGPHLSQQLGSKGGQASEVQILSFRQRVAEVERAVVRYADDVASPGFFREFPVLGQEENRVIDGKLLAGSHLLQLHAPFEMAGGQAHEGDAVAVLRIHIRLDLEHEARDLGICRRNLALGGWLRTRRGRKLRHSVEQFANPKVVQGRAEVHRGLGTFTIALQVESGTKAARHLHFFAKLGDGVLRQQLVELWIIDAAAGVTLVRTLALGAFQKDEAVAKQVVAATELPSHADRPGSRAHLERKRLLDFLKQLEGIPRFSVHLVDQGNDRYVAQAADLEELAGLRFYTLRGVDHHHR